MTQCQRFFVSGSPQLRSCRYFLKVGKGKERWAESIGHGENRIILKKERNHRLSCMMQKEVNRDDQKLYIDIGKIIVGINFIDYSL